MLCAVLCGHHKDLAGQGWAPGPPEPWGEELPVLGTVSLRGERRREGKGERREAPAELGPPGRSGLAGPGRTQGADEPVSKAQAKAGTSSCSKVQKAIQAGRLSQRR